MTDHARARRHRFFAPDPWRMIAILALCPCAACSSPRQREHAACDEAAELVASTVRASLPAGPAACTAVVRLGYVDHVPLGAAFLCGPSRPVTEDDAFALIDAQCTFGVGDVEDPSGADETDELVLMACTPNNGCGGAVSARTGELVYAGHLRASGPDSVSTAVDVPDEWLDPLRLGSGCEDTVEVPARGFALTWPSAPLDTARVDLALAAVRAMGIGLGFARAGLVPASAMVLLHPASPIGHRDGEAEWIVLLDAETPP